MIQALLCGAAQWNKRQRAETAAHEVPPEHEEQLYCAGDRALEQPREAAESPSLEILHKRLDAILCTVLWDPA